MADGQPTAIEIKGITRNRTKIGVEDGMAEDLINLRFVNGAWRTSGDGRHVYSMSDNASGHTYTQIFVHTNVYRHVLGVRNGKLWWFASIDTDGVTFAPLTSGNSTSSDAFKKTLPNAPVELTSVVGDVWISQNGHLVTVIDENDGFVFCVYKKDTQTYTTVEIDTNGKQTSRRLYPFGRVNFNLQCEANTYQSKNDGQYIVNDSTGINHNNSPACIPRNNATDKAAEQIWHAEMLNAFNKATEDNQFTRPFLAMIAVRLYDGSYMFSSNPVFLNPREKLSMDGKTYIHNGLYISDEVIYDSTTSHSSTAGYYKSKGGWYSLETSSVTHEDEASSESYMPIFSSGASTCRLFDLQGGIADSPVVIKNTLEARVRGANLMISIEDIDTLLNNRDVFTGIGIFVTKQSDVYYMGANDYDKGSVKLTNEIKSTSGITNVTTMASYSPGRRTKSEIIYDLINSPFYLLRDYSVDELSSLKEHNLVDIRTEPKYKKILSNITQSTKFVSSETTDRQTYLPKVSYMYNGRLHIADYTSYPFFGYPIDNFFLHNHSVKREEGTWIERFLSNLAYNYDSNWQYAKTSHSISPTAEMITASTPYLIVKVTLTTQQGKRVVTRYVQSYDTSTPVNGRCDIYESLNALLSYPDSRASKMEIYLVDVLSDDVESVGFYFQAGAHVSYKSFDLKPHPYLNIAYHIDSELKPIWDFEDLKEVVLIDGQNILPSHTISEIKEYVKMENINEDYPNGLKVSKTDNPLFFPIENTYQVGSGEIIALMSNAIAVGSGQTGDAPLYVFCTDGIYALYVDDSGQMAYPYSRPLADDVCNNPRSVTRTDLGVVFSTDRGLMRISGNEVQEIGEPAEGDVLPYTDATKGIKFVSERLQFVSGYPTSICDETDFLTYLKGTIINYNHNERELMVSNPDKPYSYVMDMEGNWSRRDYTANEYVNNYPTSYRLINGEFYKVDEEGSDSTPLEQRKEADNRFFYLSNIIKLNSIGFKEAHRFVVRGHFETKEKERWNIMFPNLLLSSSAFYNGDTSVLVHPTMSWETQFSVGDKLRFQKKGDRTYQDVEVVSFDTNPYRMNFSSNLQNISGSGASYILSKYEPMVSEHPYIGCYVLGSYDGRKWSVLGGNEKTGTFDDIGCLVERTDVRFLRVCLAGQVTGKTRINYMEMSARGSVLNTKIR